MEAVSIIVILMMTRLDLSLSTTQQLYLDTYINCDKTFEVNKVDEIVVEEEEKVYVNTRAAPQCTLTFKAKDPEGRLCVQITRLTFKNCNMELRFHDTLMVTNERTTTFHCNESYSLPMEWCSTDRYMMLFRFSESRQASVRDLDLIIIIRHISNRKRTVYLDAACNGVYPILQSVLTVNNRQLTGPDNLPQNCSATFKYVGEDKNYTACLVFHRQVTQCSYDLEVFDGINKSHVYSCTQPNPSRWCSKSGTITLKMIRREVSRVIEPEHLFFLQVKDEPPAGFPSDGLSQEALTAVVVVSVIVLLVLLAAIIFFILRYRHRNKEPEIIELPAATRPANGVVDVPLISRSTPVTTEQVQLQRLNHPS
ncbi:uncharacterized protein LOC121373568 [Gigantopelta aegis]|uniref:uncharacterized protein LOC121373568 n=1 Tax=Gigantopelta aegis TaxID=1735272 RepID=UPI001B8877AF|nr:uncharacterized protein LOC121373568 [Gigantopelta aegis]